MLAWCGDIEGQAVLQLMQTASLPFVRPHVAAMPDAHLGRGATVGSVVPCVGAVVPAAVGVDIGCGMSAVRLSLKAGDLPDSMSETRSAIEAAVPVGRANHADPRHARKAIERLSPRRAKLLAKAPKSAHLNPKCGWERQIGTLGSGNHFIELCLDEEQRLWLMLHSGSRGAGNLLGSHYISVAQKEAQRNGERLPNKDLAFLRDGSDAFDAYVEAVDWCQQYARENRRAMQSLALKAIAKTLPPFKTEKGAVDCHHNYLSRERHFGIDVMITRKGAISARKDEWGIIPGSMGDRSYIVQGLGCAEALHSCAHGAGRRMSRTEAKQRFSLNDLAKQTQGVECRRDASVIDEAPGAYKNIDEVMRKQADLAKPIHTLKQIVCVKG